MSGELISKQEAITMVTAYKNNSNPNGTSTIYGDIDLSVLNSFLKSRTDITGIRIYNAEENGNNTFVVVGYKLDDEGNHVELGELNGVVGIERNLICPPYCNLNDDGSIRNAVYQ
jgi:hypothetical protein